MPKKDQSASTQRVTPRTSAGSARDKLVETAYQMFSNRGFEAVSLADIAGELGLTKQAIIYHFKNKNALYAEVLAALAERYDAIVQQARQSSDDPQMRWRQLLVLLLAHSEEQPADAGLVARELLDNRERAKGSHRWYLRDFLDSCVALYAATEEGGAQDLPTQRVMVYRQIGALTYMVISEVTLGAIWGKTAIANMQRVQRNLLTTL